jgi:hypothetical protein
MLIWFPRNTMAALHDMSCVDPVLCAGAACAFPSGLSTTCACMTSSVRSTDTSAEGHNKSWLKRRASSVLQAQLNLESLAGRLCRDIS